MKMNEGITKEQFKCGYISRAVWIGPGQSHLIAKEQKFKNPLQMISDENFDSLLKMLQEANNLEYFQVSGGEPFQHKARLRKILNNISKNIIFYMHTNGSIFDNEVVEMCKKNIHKLYQNKEIFPDGSHLNKTDWEFLIRKFFVPYFKK